MPRKAHHTLTELLPFSLLPGPEALIMCAGLQGGLTSAVAASWRRPLRTRMLHRCGTHTTL